MPLIFINELREGRKGIEMQIILLAIQWKYSISTE